MSATVKRKTFERHEQTYTRCYCEENIYMMCKSIATSDPELLEKSTVVFISNPNKTIPVWKQKRVDDDGLPVIWDYHVVLLCSLDERLIYDLDTTLPFPCPLERYVLEAFHPELQLRETFKRRFRLIPASTYLREFASDRSHMLRDGEYIHPPPQYAPISTQETVMNLPRYIEMISNNEPEKYGVVISEDEFFSFAFSTNLDNE